MGFFGGRTLVEKVAIFRMSSKSRRTYQSNLIPFQLPNWTRFHLRAACKRKQSHICLEIPVREIPNRKLITSQNVCRYEILITWLVILVRLQGVDREPFHYTKNNYSPIINNSLVSNN